MKKSKKPSFLYKYRFFIGYGLLMLAFFSLLSFLPSIAPNGISEYEMNSAVRASNLSLKDFQPSQLIDLPYLLVQKFCLAQFGLSLLTIKLPSIIFGVFTALFIVLLINRWFKSDVAIFGSILTVLSTAFLFTSTSGTPNIMYLFWLSLILWLGSKIIGAEKTPPALIFAFFIAVALSIYTPFFFYIALAIAVAGVVHPQLRSSMGQLSKVQSILCPLIAILLLLPLIFGCITEPDIIKDFLFTDKLSLGKFLGNISSAFAPFFSFSLSYDSVYLAPLFGLSTVALIFIGVIATLGNPFSARNTAVDLLIVFAILFSGLKPNVAILIVIPIAILSAAGIESIFKKWHSLFPTNPYAHFIGNMPVLVVILMIVVSGLTHFIYGYHYTPNVAKNFSNDVEIVSRINKGNDLVINTETDNYEFYKLFEKYNGLHVHAGLPKKLGQYVTILGSTTKNEQLQLKQIITSPKSRNSARLYVYEKVRQ